MGDVPYGADGVAIQALGKAGMGLTGGNAEHHAALDGDQEQGSARPEVCSRGPEAGMQPTLAHGVGRA